MKKRSGFTLIELSGIIAIIGVLAAILLPALARARESGRRVSCMANLVNMSVAFQCYAQEHDRQLPWSGGKNNARCLMKLRGDYISEMGVFICPSDSNASWRGDDSETISANFNSLRNAEYSVRTSYDYLGAYTKSPITVPPAARPLPPRFPIMWDLAMPQVVPEMSRRRRAETARWGNGLGIDLGASNHIPGGNNVLMLDGSIEFILWQETFKPWMPVNPHGIDYEMPQPPTEREQARVEAISSHPIIPDSLISNKRRR